MPLSIVVEELADDSKLKYYLACWQDHVPVLPIFQKISAKTLNLTGYSLSPDVSRVFAHSLETRQNSLFNRLVLD